MAEVLLYNVRENYDLDRFKEIAAANGVAIKYAGKDDIDQKVGALIDLPGYERTEDNFEFDENLDFDFILFAGFERNELFAFLDLMRENGLSIQHKAGETHNNIDWTLRELLIENDREGKMMGLIHRINSMLAHADQLQKTHGEDENLLNLMTEVQGYFSDSNIFELEMAQMYHSKLFEEVLRYKEDKGIV